MMAILILFSSLSWAATTDCLATLREESTAVAYPFTIDVPQCPPGSGSCKSTITRIRLENLCRSLTAKILPDQKLLVKYWQLCGVKTKSPYLKLIIPSSQLEFLIEEQVNNHKLTVHCH